MSTNIQNSPDISINKLEEVFSAFNQVSAELGNRYKELEIRVSNLNEELAATHSARIKELTEKERLAAKLTSLMDALPGGVIVLDKLNSVIEENSIAKQMLEGSNIGNNWQLVLANAASCNPVLNGELSFQNGKRISINSSIYGDKGEKIILLTDVSENYRLNNLINREKRLTALGEMAARLAHQVRTPLSAAILYLSHLSFSTGKQDVSLTTVGKILDRLKQIERLIDGMLSYIRGDTHLEQEFSLTDLLHDIKDAACPHLELSKGELTLVHPTQSCKITGDREALFNAFANLVENSIQSAHRDDPKIQVSLSRSGSMYKIRVADNGPGIDDSIKEKIFDPFFSTRVGGTGLGLAVVLSAVRAHNGKIYIKSATKNGTVIEVLIPAERTGSKIESGIWGGETISNREENRLGV
ncbi:MAG: hypothetical protein COA96_04800 [SAR86 cluster bacterium]|uniref:histidine kinase n=1 Tax=SAR86 cluster bacterium TaxID=2030880 RepID=A0A2A5B5P8_9GAMM|nr:MAG: hypothetical protein COA96_04800 [SAR86 cluster bacterium]